VPTRGDPDVAESIATLGYPEVLSLRMVLQARRQPFAAPISAAYHFERRAGMKELHIGTSAFTAAGWEGN